MSTRPRLCKVPDGVDINDLSPDEIAAAENKYVEHITALAKRKTNTKKSETLSTSMTEDQRKWLILMAKAGLLTEIENKTKTKDKPYLYYNTSNGTIFVGKLNEFKDDNITTGTEQYGMHSVTTTNKVITLQIENFATGKIENIAYTDCSVYEVPSEIPQRNPLLPSDDRLITEPSPQQLEWLSTMIRTGQIQKIQEISQENKGKYYLFKKHNSGTLSGGYLFKIDEKRRTISQQYQDGIVTSDDVKYQTYSFYSPSLLLTLDIESDKDDIYPLPDQLPTSAPKTRRFARIIDVDDKTGQLTLHDGTSEQKMNFNESHHIIEFDPTTKTGTFIPLSNLITLNSNPRYFFTGSSATRIFVQKICDDTKRLYVQLEFSNNEPLQGNNSLSDSEINEIENIAKDIAIPDKSSCETKGHPIEKVRGPRFYPAKFTQFDASHHKSGVQVYYYDKRYDGEGGFSSSVKVNKVFTTNDGRPACSAISLTQYQDSPPIGILTTVLFVLKDEVEAANAKSEKEIIEQNLRKVTGKKVEDEVYFYETREDEVKRQNPKKGKIVKLKGLLGIGKSYDLSYDSGKVINVKNIYLPENGQNGGNKNKTRRRRRRKYPRKSIKKKQSSRKGRKRHSIRRSRSRK
jgi:hypothetical protein